MIPSAGKRDLFDVLQEKVSPDVSNAVFRAYAEAMFEAQGLEGMLSLLLFEVGFEKSSKESIRDFERIAWYDYERPLGRLIEALKREIRPLPKGLKKDLKHALDIRNSLAHDYFIHNFPKLLYDKWGLELVLELKEMRATLKQVNSRLMEISEMLPRPKTRLAMKELERRAGETILSLVKLVRLAEELKEPEHEAQLKQQLKKLGYH